MSAQGYLTDMVGMVDELTADLTEQQESHDAFHAEARATCDRLIPEYRNKMTNHAEQRDLCKKLVTETTSLREEAME